MIGAIVCCAAAIGGDNLQDLKTGYIVGATPWKQQIMQIIGVLSASVVLGVVLDILHTAYTIGSPSLSAPQATLMKSVADGVFKGNLPWDFVYFGAAIAVIIILLDIRQEKRGSEFRIPVLAVAVGIYLPIELTVPIFIGGMINHLAKNTGTSTSSEENGLLLASGLITGETLMAIFIALPIFLTGNKDWWPTFPGYDILGILSFIAIIFLSLLIKKDYMKLAILFVLMIVIILPWFFRQQVLEFGFPTNHVNYSNADSMASRDIMNNLINEENLNIFEILLDGENISKEFSNLEAFYYEYPEKFIPGNDFMIYLYIYVYGFLQILFGWSGYYISQIFGISIALSNFLGLCYLSFLYFMNIAYLVFSKINKTEWFIYSFTILSMSFWVHLFFL